MPSRPVAWLVAALAMVGLALRLVWLDDSLFGDELFLYVIVDEHSLGEVLSTVRDTEKTPPLGFVLAWLTGQAGGPELTRLPSFAASVATVPLVYLLGVRTLGRAAGVVAAAWFALSPYEIFYGTESRSYALVTAFVVLSTVSLLAALDRQRSRWWALYALAATGAIYSHYIAALILLPQAAWALWTHRDSVREQLLANGAVVLAFMPWFPSFLIQARHSADEAKRLAEITPVSLSNVGEAVGKALFGHPFVALRDLPGRLAIALLAALLVLALIAVAVGERRAGHRFKPKLSTRGALLVLLAVAPPLGIVLYSLRPDTSFLLARNLSGAVPYALVLFGWLLTTQRPRVSAALSVAAIALVGVGTVELLDSDNGRPNAEAAARFIDANAGPDTPVIETQLPFSGPPGRATRIYLEHRHRFVAYGASLWPRAAEAGSPVVMSYPSLPALDRLLRPRKRYVSRYRLVAEHTYPGFRAITVRKYAPRPR